jgi:hypothetical protein
MSYYIPEDMHPRLRGCENLETRRLRGFFCQSGMRISWIQTICSTGQSLMQLRLVFVAVYDTLSISQNIYIVPTVR